MNIITITIVVGGKSVFWDICLTFNLLLILLGPWQLCPPSCHPHRQVLASLLHFGPRPPSASFLLAQPVCRQLPTRVRDQQRSFTVPALLLVQQRHFVRFYGGTVSFWIFWLTAEFMILSIMAGLQPQTITLKPSWLFHFWLPVWEFHMLDHWGMFWIMWDE